jgi:hypothetical protein
MALVDVKTGIMNAKKLHNEENHDRVIEELDELDQSSLTEAEMIDKKFMMFEY